MQISSTESRGISPFIETVAPVLPSIPAVVVSGHVKEIISRGLTYTFKFMEARRAGMY